jgi:ATP-binding protein involved in chromosome partitioning
LAFWNKDKSTQAPGGQSSIDKPGLADIKSIIAIASGKGGVGKSTVATNLAFALARNGQQVGLLDADIYGPSQPGMLGAELEPPKAGNNRMFPSERHGISFISMGLFLGDGGPVVWRAPMAMKMIQQFLANVVWGELDYLLIDLPPGTGDVQLTLAQQAQLTGAVIVTTPQEVAIGVARKGLKMFTQVNVPIIGIVENMSGFVCGHCGQETPIFGVGGGKRMADEFETQFLGSIPLDPAIMASGEDGIPVVARDPKSGSAQAYLKLAENITARIEEMKKTGNMLEPENIAFSPKGDLYIRWPKDESRGWLEGHTSIHTAHHLRTNCRCAVCVDENTGRKTLDDTSVPLDIEMKGVNPVGRYAIAIGFSDGHNTGIYTFSRLRDLCECEECAGLAREASFDV